MADNDGLLMARQRLCAMLAASGTSLCRPRLTILPGVQGSNPFGPDAAGQVCLASRNHDHPARHMLGLRHELDAVGFEDVEDCKDGAEFWV